MVAHDRLEALRAAEFPKVMWELLDKARCVVYSDPRKERFGELLIHLVQFYAKEDKCKEIGVSTGRGKWKRVQQGNQYVVVCPGYDRARMQATLEGLDATQFAIKGAEDWKVGAPTSPETMEKTTVYLCGPLAVYNRLVLMGRRGLGVRRIIVMGLDQGLLSQEWYLYSNLFVRLAEFARLRPPLCVLLSHPQPTLLYRWLITLGLDPTIIQQQRLLYDFQMTRPATFPTRDALFAHAHGMGVDQFCLYSAPPTKAVFILRAASDRVKQWLRVRAGISMTRLRFWVKAPQPLKRGRVRCSITKVQEGGESEELTPSIEVALTDILNPHTPHAFTKCEVDLAAHGIVLEAGTTYAVGVQCTEFYAGRGVELQVGRTLIV